VGERIALFPVSGELNYRVPDAKATIAAFEPATRRRRSRRSHRRHVLRVQRLALQPAHLEHRALIRLNVEARGSEKLMRAKTDELLALLKAHGAVPRTIDRRRRMPSHAPKLSVVIPVYNEEAGAADLVRAAVPGARRARHLLRDACSSTTAARIARWRCCASSSSAPAHTRVVLFHANFGQHSAVMAGFAYARGEYVVTLDADLQNPPEEIGKLVDMLDQGYDYVGTIRQQRQDTLVAALVLEGHQQAARADHAGAHHRSGLHDARLRALRGDRAQSDPRGQHLHSGAGLAVCHAAHRGADRPRGALCRGSRSIRCTA
jgi:hypothetical protein